MRTARAFLSPVIVALLVCPPQASAVVSSTANSVTYIGNGATTAFVATFPFQKTGDLVVTVAGVTKTLDTDYAVSGAGNATGTVTFTSAPANSAVVVITRTVDYKQGTSFKQQSIPSPAAVEAAIDKATMQIQQLQALVTSPPVSVLPSNVTAKLNNIRFADQFANIQAAITDAGTTGAVIIPSSYGGVDVYVNPSGIPIIDLRGGPVGWRGFLNVKSDYGAVGNNVADDTGPIQTALNAAAALANGAIVFFPPGKYKVISPLVIATSGVHLVGSGVNTTWLSYGGGATAYVIKVGTPTPTVTSVENFMMRDMTVAGNANVTDVLFTTGNHRSLFSNLALRDATGCGLHTQGSDINTYERISVTNHPTAFLVQPTSGLCFEWVNGTGNSSTASAVIEPIVEGVSGDGIKLFNGTSTFEFKGGTSEGNARGISIASGCNDNVVIGLDMEANSTEDVLVNGSFNEFRGGLSSTTAHLGATSISTVLHGGQYNTVTIDAGAKANEVDVSYQVFTDNGTDTKAPRLWNLGTGKMFDGAPWSFRDTVPPLGFTTIANADRQDLLAGVYNFTTTPTVLSNTVLQSAATPWRVLFVGMWVNNTEAGGLAEPAPIIEATTASPTFAIGSVSVTVSVNGSNQVQAVTNANRAAFSGRIFVISNSFGVAGTASMLLKGSVGPGSTTQASLGTPSNGVIIYCSDCTIANPCAGGGTGAIAKRLNGAWVCN